MTSGLIWNRTLQFKSPFYVATTGSDSNAGTLVSPWATLTHAGAVVQPGDAVFVLPGNYSEAAVLANSGTANKRITFLSSSKWGAKFNGGAGFTIDITGDYIDVVGFDVTTTAAIGIRQQGSHCGIYRNFVHDVSGTGGGAIDIFNNTYTNSDSTIAYNFVTRTGGHAIYVAVPITRIYNNLCIGSIGSVSGQCGIHCWHAYTGPGSIVNNLTAGCTSTGVLVGCGDAPGGVTMDNMIVANNICCNNGTWGMQFTTSGTGDTLGPNNQVLNNCIYGNPSGVFASSGPGSTVVATGTVSATNAQFVNYQTDGSGDYHLAAGAPCINAGVATAGPADDLDGVFRPVGSGYDIGPYER